jgi:hypothetical protein
MSNDSVDDLINQLDQLRIQETNILQRLVTARERETRARARETPARRQEAEDDNFSFGDRIQITNKVRLSFGRAVTINDRRAIVTSTTPTRVYFRTVNGTNTWRARANLRKVREDEVWNN